LAEGNFIENFIKEFVPKDLEPEDLVDFTKRQKDFPDEWDNLKAEVLNLLDLLVQKYKY
jgi:hypothetical protein